MKKFIKVSLLAIAISLVYLYGASMTIASRENVENNKVPGQYIIVLNDEVQDVDGTADRIEKENGLGHLQTYKHAIKGFAATIPDAKLDMVKNDPFVKFVSEDRIMRADGKSGSGGSGSQPAQVLPKGVDRIDAENSISKGAGVTVAVIDTGIDTSHPDLSGQIVGGKNCSSGKPNNYKDGNGHGTHVAGTIAALDNSIGVVGVAPQARLLAVRVLDNAGNGSWSSVICGIDWVTANAAKYNIKVANMSLGGAGSSDNNCGNIDSDALHQAICRSRDAGVAYVVAAGNESDNASNHVPAAYDDAVITVSALADSDGASGGIGSNTSYGNYPDDTFASFGNFGSVVDVGAPGVDIRSTWKGGTYNTISGTSMASPHVAGVAALYISSNPGSSWIQVRDALKTSGETLGNGHSDPSGNHPESVVNANGL